MKRDQQKRKFRRDAVAYGLTDGTAVRKLYPVTISSAEVETFCAWLDRMLRSPKMSALPRTTRLVNHFLLGADPEFVFVEQHGLDGPTRVNADMVGLKAGPAFGADSNGRLVEIRPHPSRSALEVVASTLSTMRWLALTNEASRAFEWQTGAYKFDDGLGGHVHLGRKRPGRDAEVRALDVLGEMLVGLEVFPKGEVLARRRGDRHGQRYGVPGSQDAVRLQTHGYEYRVLPSWLDSPYLAFLCLTLAKLGVYDPELAKRFEGDTTPELSRQRLMNFLAYFKGTDDDARVAYWCLLHRGLPRHQGGDFRKRWGITYEGLGNLTNVTVIPGSIPPHPDDVQEVFDHLVHLTPLRARVPQPTWEPTREPEGFVQVLHTTATTHVKGMGELVYDLCVPRGMKIEFRGAEEEYGRDRDAAIVVSSAMEKLLPHGWKKELAEKLPAGMAVGVGPGNTPKVGITPWWREGTRAKLVKRVLVSGVFPIWKLGDATQEKLDAWVAKRQVMPALVQAKFGKAIYHKQY